MKTTMVITLFLCITLKISAFHTGVIIIVHGTWGINSPWCKPGGDFFDALELNAAQFGKKVVTYSWPGYLNHDDRVIAAKGLAKLIQSYPTTMNVALVAHSHGGNVSILASHILANDPNNDHYIDALYTLGTPINATTYMPNMNSINRVYNFFSFADMVQPVLGIFERTFPAHPRIANIRLMLNDQEPGHLELCVELTGAWLPYVDESLAQQKIGNFHHFDFSVPAIIYLSSSGNPLYAIDTQRDTLLEKDRFMMREMMDVALRYKKVKETFRSTRLCRLPQGG